MDRLLTQAALLMADEGIQRFGIMVGAGMGIGIALIALFAAFPSKTPGPNYSRVLDFGVYSEDEHKSLSEEKHKERSENLARVKAALLGPEPSAKPDSDEAAAIDAIADNKEAKPSSVRRRRGGNKAAPASEAKAGAAGSDSDAATSTPLGGNVVKARDSDGDEDKEDDGASTDEEDMNPNLSAEQRKLQKALLGTRSRKKLKKVLDAAEKRAQAGDQGHSRRSVTRALDCVVYLIFLALLIYALQFEYEIDVPMVFSHFFPREAAVLAGRTGASAVEPAVKLQDVA